MLIHTKTHARTHTPNKEHVEVSSGHVEALLLRGGESKANGEDREGQGQQPAQDEQNGPHSEPGAGIEGQGQQSPRTNTTAHTVNLEQYRED